MTPLLGRMIAALPGAISLAESIYAALAKRHGAAATTDEAELLAAAAHARLRRAVALRRIAGSGK